MTAIHRHARGQPLHPDATPRAHRLATRIGSILAAIRALHRARRDEAHLSRMSDRMLGDIGLSRDDARAFRRPPPC
ncbi:DUF1127 domain-containing protein [Cereibacter sphaeroides]|uniref:DUF1127 domain-containing protein n=1 Tax=Cereibacter sphaeroides TaxID=1063 RepID=UPI003AF10CE5|nr:DUF1127 domain-containing protein [Cereibacter sphaeroides]MCE6971952.1 DUF1127 domain-containing protein [Cereibacter sphaeroides]